MPNTKTYVFFKRGDGTFDHGIAQGEQMPEVGKPLPFDYAGGQEEGTVVALISDGGPLELCSLMDVLENMGGGDFRFPNSLSDLARIFYEAGKKGGVL